MAAHDHRDTFGRTRLSFADEKDVDEFVATLDRFERGRSVLTNGARSVSCAGRTASGRPPTSRCCA